MSASSIGSASFLSPTNPHLEKVKAIYAKPSPHYYIHFHMINPLQPEAFYQSQRFEKALGRIDEIYQGRKSPFLFRRAGWTPAHVAVICGNETGLNVLMKRGCIQEIPDNEGRLPRDYARMYHPHLVKYFIPIEKKPDEKVDGIKSKAPASETYKALVQQVSKVSVAKVPPLPSTFIYKLGQDFGVEILTLLFSCHEGEKDSVKIGFIVENMRILSQKLGFKLQLTEKPYFVRDLWMRTASGTPFSFSNSEHVRAALVRANSLALYQGQTPAYLTRHTFYKAFLGASHPFTECAFKDYMQLTQKQDLPLSIFFLEGGNHFCVTNKNGAPSLFISEEMVPIIHNQLRLQKTYSLPELNLEAAKNLYLQQLTADKDLLEEAVLWMYVQGILKINGKTGLISNLNVKKTMISISESTTVEKRHPHLQEAIDKGYFTPPTLPKDLSKIKETAATCLAQRDMAIAVVAQSFSVLLKHTATIPPLFYHLDLFMRPGPKGSFFGPDFDLTLKCLQEIETHQDTFQLSQRDRQLLQEHIETTQTLKKEIGHLLMKMRVQIDKTGFFYLPVPGLFMGKSPPSLSEVDSVQTNHVNFLNAITGWSSKTGKYYYITGGAGVGDRLGKIFQDVFEESLKHYCPDIEVYYVGYDPQSPEDFSEPHRLFNTYGQQCGVHCLSFEWETAPHTH